MSGTRNETVAIMQAAQSSFMQRGGTFEMALAKLRASGDIDSTPVFREYPKEIRIQRGEHVVHCETETNKGKTIEWDETRPIIETLIVNSEEEEDRVLNGGKTAAQIEDDRLSLIEQCKSRHILYDPSWSLLRLQKELGMPVADRAPAFDELAELRAQVAKAEEALALRKRLAELNAELTEPVPTDDDVEALRLELQDLGVKVDGRWSAARLRQELDRATAPGKAA